MWSLGKSAKTVALVLILRSQFFYLIVVLSEVRLLEDRSVTGLTHYRHLKPNLLVTTQRIHILPHNSVIVVLQWSHIVICSQSPSDNALF